MNDLVFNADKIVGSKYPTYVIAEVGQNHQGDLEIAKDLIKKAKECGADCVKFQKSCLPEKFTKSTLNLKYDSEHSWGKTYGEHKKHLEFSDEQYIELQKYATELGIHFSASAMDEISLIFLKKLNTPFIKIGSGDATNILLLEKAAKTGKPLIVSTGMCSMEDVDLIYKTIYRQHKNFALLHCVSSYPTKPCDANLGNIARFQSKYPVCIGYSGHEMGYNLTLAAVALGAKIVERHITPDKTWKGNDHSCSLNIVEFKSMVSAIREIEEGMGMEKRLLTCEEACWKKLGRTTSRTIEADNPITEDELVQ
ncbi:sialic acid synthase isoform X2 [Halyomorpha halys]|uniref:sialic acid synthase isoform X2 n=1 Tax=Halyomorpha halys TaxID=286706 RepID=UPI0006D51184|nr:sialic acid synthase isoform X2 [Halyomorpha halys]